MNSTNSNTINPEIITLVDDDEIQQNIPITAAAKPEGSRRKSTTTTELLNCPIAKKADKVGHRRRKTFHKILNADDEITFESIIPSDNQVLPSDNQEVQATNKQPSKTDKVIEKSPSQSKIQKLFTNNKNDQPISTNLNGYRTDYLSRENPNTEFIQRVAFLRSCVNYMLKNAGKEAINFKYGDNTLSKLVNNYNCVSNEPEEIVLSD